MATTDEGLVLDHVTSGYGGVTVLRDVSIVAPPGDVVAILGPNGAGKTTLLRTIFGLTDLAGGTIRYDGRDITSSPPHEVARLGLCYVTEGRAIFRGMTVRENLDMFARGEVPPERVERVHQMFPVLRERGRQLAGTLSGGQQQMLSIARALVQEPRVLLVDELSMGLAPVVVDDLFEILARLKEQGQSIVLVEQYAERALALADIVYVLTRGEVSFAGDPEILTGSPDMMRLYLGGEAA